MKHKPSKLSQSQNVTTTITTLREHAREMLRVADHLEATQRFMGNGVSNVIRGSGKRNLSLVTRKKIGKANKARAAAKRKVLPIVGKTTAA